MAVTLEELRATLRVEMKPFIRDMQQINGISAKSARLMESTWLQTSKKLDGFGKSMASSLITPMAGIGAALGTRELAQLADTWSDLTSRINIAAGSQAKGVEVMGRLGEMARMTYSGLEQTTESYLSNSTAIKDLGYSTDQTLDYTEALNNALVVSGAKGDKAARVIDALSKSMALGKLQGDNLNTVISTGDRVARALAAGLGTSVSGLRTLGAQGKITGRDIVTALTSQMATLRKEAESMPATISDGFQLLNNAMLQYVGNADTATGISAKVAEALIIIADNFDKVADSGLQVAAVLAGALVGRSLTGMIAKLALSTAELKKFIGVLSAARTLGGMATAMTGLSAAAGPLGMIIGGAVVGSLVNYGIASADAAEKSKTFQRELENMGLLAKQAAEDVDAAAVSVDEMSAADKKRKLKSIADELERLRNGGGLFGGQGDELGSIADKAMARLKSLAGQWNTSTPDKSGRQEIASIATEFRDMQIGAEEARQRLEALKNTDITQPVVDLANELKRTIDVIAAGEAAAVSFGEMPGLETAKQGVIELRDQLSNLAEQDQITAAQQKDLQDLLNKLVTTSDGADDARAALAKIGQDLPNLAGFFSTMDAAIAKLGEVIARSKEANAVLANAGINSKTVDAYKQYQNSRSEGQAIVVQRNAYEKDAIRKAQLGKDQLALENKIASVREKSIKDGQQLTEDQIRRIADAELAGERTRTAEGKKPKKETHKKTDEDYFTAQIQQVNDRTAALAEEARVTGLTYLEQEKRMMALDLEQSVLQRLREEARQKGITDLESIQLSSTQREAINATSEAYARQADELRKIQEAQGNAENAGQQFTGTLKSGLFSLVTGADNLKNALGGVLMKLGELIANSAFDKLFNGATQSGGIVTSVFKMLGFADGGVFANGRSQPLKKFSKGGVSREAAIFGEAGAEAAVPLPDGRRIPVDLRMPQPPQMPDISKFARNMQPITLSPVYQIDAKGSNMTPEQIKGVIEEVNKNSLPQLAEQFRQLKRRGLLE